MNDAGPSRRSFMIRAIIGIFMFIGAVLAVPLGGFGILPALRKNKPGWSDIGTVSDLAVDEPQERRFSELVRNGWQEEKQERSVWIVMKPDRSVVVFSPNCPHLGCGYRWFSADLRFKCPCHGSVFDIDGRVLAGPAPRPLDTLDVKIDGGRIFVKYQAYQLGTASKVAV